MTNFLRIGLIVVALIVGALLLACGSDSDSDADGTAPADDSSTEPADGNGDQPSGDAATELRTLAGHFGEQEDLPTSLKGRRYYTPREEGAEQEIGKRLRRWWGGEKPRPGETPGDGPGDENPEDPNV